MIRDCEIVVCRKVFKNDPKRSRRLRRPVLKNHIFVRIQHIQSRHLKSSAYTVDWIEYRRHGRKGTGEGIRNYVCVGARAWTLLTEALCIWRVAREWKSVAKGSGITCVSVCVRARGRCWQRCGVFGAWQGSENRSRRDPELRVCMRARVDAAGRGAVSLARGKGVEIGSEGIRNQVCVCARASRGVFDVTRLVACGKEMKNSREGIQNQVAEARCISVT
jgi:hypothetical protein